MILFIGGDVAHSVSAYKVAHCVLQPSAYESICIFIC